MRISDWSSDVCSSDLSVERGRYFALVDAGQVDRPQVRGAAAALTGTEIHDHAPIGRPARPFVLPAVGQDILAAARRRHDADAERSEEHTSELQSLMRISYAVCCLKKKKKCNNISHT